MGNTTFNLNALVRPHILTLKPYSSARDEYSGAEGVFLDANENPFGSVIEGKYNRYPDPYQSEVKTKIGALNGLRKDQIFLGNGSDEPIDLLIRALCTPGKDSILIMPPTYGMYEVSAGINDVGVIRVPLTRDFQVDTAAVIDALEENTKIIWVCSPNNPTGNLIHEDSIHHLVENFPGLVVVDEAYIDFAGTDSWTKYLDRYPNLVVLQTFSKSWGLAALRSGMCFGSTGLISILNKIKPPYNISAPTQKLLFEALDHAAQKDALVKEILHEKGLLHTMLADLSFVSLIHPSDANFLLVRFENAKEVMEYLIREKIIVRDRSNVKLCEDCLRITVGTGQENKILIDALKEIERNPEVLSPVLTTRIS